MVPFLAHPSPPMGCTMSAAKKLRQGIQKNKSKETCLMEITDRINPKTTYIQERREVGTCLETALQNHQYELALNLLDVYHLWEVDLLSESQTEDLIQHCVEQLNAGVYPGNRLLTYLLKMMTPTSSPVVLVNLGPELILQLLKEKTDHLPITVRISEEIKKPLPIKESDLAQLEFAEAELMISLITSTNCLLGHYLYQTMQDPYVETGKLLVHLTTIRNIPWPSLMIIILFLDQKYQLFQHLLPEKHLASKREDPQMALSSHLQSLTSMEDLPEEAVMVGEDESWEEDSWEERSLPPEFTEDPQRETSLKLRELTWIIKQSWLCQLDQYGWVHPSLYLWEKLYDCGGWNEQGPQEVELMRKANFPFPSSKTNEKEVISWIPTVSQKYPIHVSLGPPLSPPQPDDPTESPIWKKMRTSFLRLSGQTLNTLRTIMRLYPFRSPTQLKQLWGDDWTQVEVKTPEQGANLARIFSQLKWKERWIGKEMIRNLDTSQVQSLFQQIVKQSLPIPSWVVGAVYEMHTLPDPAFMLGKMLHRQQMTGQPCEVDEEIIGAVTL